jgi:hypothetical protein
MLKRTSLAIRVRVRASVRTLCLLTVCTTKVSLGYGGGTHNFAIHSVDGTCVCYFIIFDEDSAHANRVEKFRKFSYTVGGR